MPIGLFLQTSPVNGIIGFLPMIAIFAIFYFLLFLPMQRQKKQTAEMLKNLKSGDEVVTSGGIVGVIVSIASGEETLIVRVKPDNVKLQIARSAVTALTSQATKAS